jgi:DNA-binding CsgD family transcriptional regulator
MNKSPPLRGREGKVALIGELPAAGRRGDHAGRRRPGQAAALAGRDADLSVVRAFLDKARVNGAALLLTGEPGVGKSALLDAAHEMAVATGTWVMRAAGVELEADVSFSGLSQVLLPLTEEFGPLGTAHENALKAALGLIARPPPDLEVVSDAVLALLRRTGLTQPLLVILDDLPWLDRASSLVLGFAGRRLAGSRVGFLVASRTGANTIFSGSGLPEHEVGPLDDDAAAGLVDARFPELAPGVCRRILAEAQGNPLALLELPVALGDLQRCELAAPPATLPLSRRLRGLFTPGVAGLPAATRYLLLLGALEGSGDLAVLRAAAGPREIDDLALAEQAGLVHVERDTGRLAFRHPLIRSAVIELSRTEDLRRAHRALAAELGDQPERQAWHLASAAIGPDQEVAGLLERVAREVLRRGDAAGAVAALLRSAQLSPCRSDRSLRLAEAACLAATVTGEMTRVRGLLADAHQVMPEGRGSLFASVAAAHLLLSSEGDIDAVHGLLVGAIREAAGPRDPALMAWLHTMLMVCSFGGRPELWPPFDAVVASLTPRAPADLDLLIRSYVDPVRDVIPVLDRLDAAISELAAEADHWRILVIGAAAVYTDRLVGCREALRRVVSGCRPGHAVIPAVSALTLLSIDAFMTGRWDRARRLTGECLETARAHGCAWRAWPADELQALLAAACGDYDTVRELTGQMVRWALPRGVVQAQMAAHHASSLAALGRGDFEDAYQEAAAISPPGVLASHVPHALRVPLDLVEAAVRTGRHQEAAAHVAAMRRAGLARISPRLAMLTSASAALAAPAGQAGRLFAAALAVPGADRWPFELARVRLAYGEHLRRGRATAEARTHLGAALTTFETLGARPWAIRAGNELRASGLATTRADSLGPASLTAQERQVATLAAAGLTNKQIGERLYLSHRTVAAHLYQIFPRLGITSRAALRDALTSLP